MTLIAARFLAEIFVYDGFDSWQDPVNEIKLEQIEPGLAVTEPLSLAGHISLECVVTNGEK